QNFGLHLDSLWVIVGIGAILAAAYCAYRDMRVAARLMLAFEGLSVLAILALSSIIVARVALATGLPVATLYAFGGIRRMVRRRLRFGVHRAVFCRI
ncbi:MAG: hypothetical protein WA633_24960, partial [Stellaceae bacterium]